MAAPVDFKHAAPVDFKHAAPVGLKHAAWVGSERSCVGRLKPRSGGADVAERFERQATPRRIRAGRRIAHANAIGGA